MNLPKSFEIRPIAASDSPAVAAIIRTVMPTFGCSGPGFAIMDPEVDDMASAYAEPRCAYFVVEHDGVVVGGGGIAPLVGGEAGTCELRKMYFLPEVRGHGVGRRLLALCLETARGLGFDTCYLETMEAMTTARHLYEAFGFERIYTPMGNTGHFGCDCRYVRAL